MPPRAPSAPSRASLRPRYCRTRSGGWPTCWAARRARAAGSRRSAARWARRWTATSLCSVTRRESARRWRRSSVCRRRPARPTSTTTAPVEDGAVVVDVGRAGLLPQTLDRLQRLADSLLVTEHSDVAVHRLAHLAADLRDPAARALLAAQQVGHPPLLVLQYRGRRLARLGALGARGGVHPGVLAEDQRVQQGVGAQPVAAVNRDAGDLARRVQPRHRGPPLDIGAHPAHRVVVAGLDPDRLLGDVHPGEVLADQDDLAQRLVHPLLGHDGDVERDGAVRKAAALVDLGLLGAGDDIAGGQLHLVRRCLLYTSDAADDLL